MPGLSRYLECGCVCDKALCVHLQHTGPGLLGGMDLLSDGLHVEAIHILHTGQGGDGPSDPGGRLASKLAHLVHRGVGHTKLGPECNLVPQFSRICKGGKEVEGG